MAPNSLMELMECMHKSRFAYEFIVIRVRMLRAALNLIQKLILHMCVCVPDVDVAKCSGTHCCQFARRLAFVRL